MATVKIATLPFVPMAPGDARYVAQITASGGNTYQIDLTTSIEFGSHKVQVDNLTIENGQSGNTVTIDFAGAYTLVVSPYTREPFPLHPGLNRITVAVSNEDTTGASTFIDLSEGEVSGAHDNQFLIQENAKTRPPVIFSYTIAGNTVFNVPTSASWLKITAVGAGGAGGGIGPVTNTGGCGGGGSGATTVSFINLSLLNSLNDTSLTVQVGAGGVGVAGANGGNGGDTRIVGVTSGAIYAVSKGGVGGKGFNGAGTVPGLGGGAGGGVGLSTGHIIDGGVSGQAGFSTAAPTAQGGVGGGPGGGLGIVLNGVAATNGNFALAGGGGGGAAMSGSAGLSAIGGAGGDGYVTIEIYD